MLIAFTGQLGSGKNLAAERLAHIVDLPVIYLSFAKKLKESAATLFGINPSEWEVLKNEPDSLVSLEGGNHRIEGQGVVRKLYAEITVREFLQRYGTEAHRGIFGDDFWVDQCLADSYKDDDFNLYLLTDCRFPNELKGIEKRGGYSIRVLSGNEPRIVYDEFGHAINADTNQVIHPSEIPLTHTTFVVNNSVRDDDFRYLDHQLKEIAWQLELPLKREEKSVYV
jgi:hypothetical protein